MASRPTGSRMRLHPFLLVVPVKLGSEWMFYPSLGSYKHDAVVIAANPVRGARGERQGRLLSLNAMCIVAYLPKPESAPSGSACGMCIQTLMYRDRRTLL